MKTTKYTVTFVLEVEGLEESDLVDEAVTAVIDDEIDVHSDGGTRCGVRFTDASMFKVEPVEERCEG